jgi:hypothetical protein
MIPSCLITPLGMLPTPKRSSRASSEPADNYCSAKMASFHDGANVESFFEPMPELRLKSGEIYVFYLSANAVRFTQKTLDPWYQATRSAGTKGDPNNLEAPRTEIFSQDEPGSPLACSHEAQFCHTGSDQVQHCSGLGSTDEMASVLLAQITDEATRKRLEWLMAPLQSPLIDFSTPSRMIGTESLRSRRSYGAGYQGPLSDRQWQIDIEHWFNIMLAAQQRMFVEVATGPPASYPEDAVRRPAGAEQLEICKSQVRS